MNGNAALRALVFAACVAGAGACKGRVSELPPYGEAVFVVDTDMPLDLASRLRVDLYSEDGRWFESRDIGRSDPRDWPASFSVYSDDDQHERRVLVRLRAYPEGITRDYEGERFAPRPNYAAPHVPDSLAELCATAPTLPIGGRVTLRRGDHALTDVVPQANCTVGNAGGAVAANVTIDHEGIYRFGVADADPYEAEAILFLRARCEDPTPQLACRLEPTASPQSTGHFPRFDVKLTPGTYTLMAVGQRPDFPADLTLESMQVDGPITPLPPLVDAGAPAASTPGPRLVASAAPGIDATPRTEPLPSATIDRLVAVRLVPGVRGSVPVTLRTACVGTMAKLGADPRTPSADTAETCVDTANVRARVAETSLETTATAELAARPRALADFGPGCTAQDSDENVVCQPSGAFLFGTRALTVFAGTRATAEPERTVLVSRFWLDRTEVSVARLRAAMASGLQVPAGTLHVDDGPYAQVQKNGDIDPETYCTFTSRAADRETLPVTCVSWSLARAFCRAQGGDLPSETQWEYAAAAAARPHKTRYPWGNDDPACDQAAILRTPASTGFLTCGTGPGGAMPVDAFSGAGGAPGDLSPTGVVGLGANVGEWMVDGAQPFASDCWNSCTLHDCRCVDDMSPYRVVRGGSWLDQAVATTFRAFIPGSFGGAGMPRASAALPNVGFRCAYAERPAR